MAEYVKLRASALKASIGLALAALIGGLPVQAQAAQSGPSKGSSLFLKLDGIAHDVRNAFIKVETRVLKLDSGIAAVEHKLAGLESARTANATFLKIDNANATFLKIDDANSTFLKVDSANSTFLKIDDANSTFLKAADANTEFLKAGATAANANELGGATVQSFSRSAAGNAIVTANGADATLLTVPGGAITVQAGVGQQTSVGTGGAGAGKLAPFVQITNNTEQTLPAVQDVVGATGPPASGDIAPGSASKIFPGSPGQAQIQFFSIPGIFGDVHGEPATLIVSIEQSGNGWSVVGQLLAGSL